MTDTTEPADAGETIRMLRAENQRLREALSDIARQKKTNELETEYDAECADFEGGFDACVDRARAAMKGETP